MPKMKHPASRKTIDVAPAQVPMYESQGWRTAPSPQKRAKADQNRATNQADAATTKE